MDAGSRASIRACRISTRAWWNSRPPKGSEAASGVRLQDFLFLAQPNLWSSPVKVSQNMGSEHDHKFVAVRLLGIVHHRLIDQRHGSEPRDPTHGEGVGSRYFSRHERGLSVLQVDASFVLPVGDQGDSVVRLSGERTDLKFEVHADRAVTVNHRLGLHVQTQILIADGREWGDVGLIAEHLRNLRRIEDRRVARIQNGISSSYMKGGIVSLTGANVHIFQTAHPRFVDGERRGQLVETESHESEPSAEGSERLAEDGILLTSQLGQQAGES